MRAGSSEGGFTKRLVRLGWGRAPVRAPVFVSSTLFTVHLFYFDYSRLGIRSQSALIHHGAGRLERPRLRVGTSEWPPINQVLRIQQDSPIRVWNRTKPQPMEQWSSGATPGVERAIRHVTYRNRASWHQKFVSARIPLRGVAQMAIGRARGSSPGGRFVVTPTKRAKLPATAASHRAAWLHAKHVRFDDGRRPARHSRGKAGETFPVSQEKMRARTTDRRRAGSPRTP